MTKDELKALAILLKDSRAPLLERIDLIATILLEIVDPPPPKPKKYLDYFCYGCGCKGLTRACPVHGEAALFEIKNGEAVPVPVTSIDPIKAQEVDVSYECGCVRKQHPKSIQPYCPWHGKARTRPLCAICGNPNCQEPNQKH